MSPEASSKNVLPIVWTSAALFGAQFAWSFEFAYGTPLLLSLGLSKPGTALAWLAGPLSGLVVHPIIGSLSDAGVHSNVIRVRFVQAGAVATVFSLAVLATSSALVGSAGVAAAVAPALAVLGLYALDFGVNVVQCAARTLVLGLCSSSSSSHDESGGDFAAEEYTDTPLSFEHFAQGGVVQDKLEGLADQVISSSHGRPYYHENQNNLDLHSGLPNSGCSAVAPSRAAAIAGMMTHAGGIAGYAATMANWPSILGLAASAQMASVAALAGATVALTAFTTAAHSGSMRPSCVSGEQQAGVPESAPRTKIVILCAMYCGRAMKGLQRAVRVHGRCGPAVRAVFRSQFATWFGWFPVLFYSTTYVAQLETRSYEPFSARRSPQARSAALRAGAASTLLFGIVALISSVLLPKVARQLCRGKHSDEEACTTLGTAHIWRLSSFLFFALTSATLFVDSTGGACVIMGLLGVPWAATVWAPAVLLTHHAQATEHLYSGQSASCVNEETRIDYTTVSRAAEEAPYALNGKREAGDGSLGAVLGLSNIYVVVPQILVALVAWLVFACAAANEDVDTASADAAFKSGSSRDVVGWLIRIGGLSALVAGSMLRAVVATTSTATAAAAAAAAANGGTGNA